MDGWIDRERERERERECDDDEAEAEARSKQWDERWQLIISNLQTCRDHRGGQACLHGLSLATETRRER